MGRSQEPLESLLSKLVAPSPVAQSLGLIHILKVARAFGMCRYSIQKEVKRGFLTVTRYRGGAYLAKQAVIDWWALYQARQYPRGMHARSMARPAAIRAVNQPEGQQLQA
jgi:hypothetical protein